MHFVIQNIVSFVNTLIILIQLYRGISVSLYYDVTPVPDRAFEVFVLHFFLYNTGTCTRLVKPCNNLQLLFLKLKIGNFSSVNS